MYKYERLCNVFHPSSRAEVLKQIAFLALLLEMAYMCGSRVVFNLTLPFGTRVACLVYWDVPVIAVTIYTAQKRW